MMNRGARLEIDAIRENGGGGAEGNVHKGELSTTRESVSDGYGVEVRV